MLSQVPLLVWPHYKAFCFPPSLCHRPIINRSQASYQNVSYSKPPTLKTSQRKPIREEPKAGGVPGWLRVLVFVVIAVFLYYVYSSMETQEENPFNQIEHT